MAKRYDPTSQDYPATLGMPPKGKPAVAGQYYGFSDDQISQMKKAGITVGDLQGMGILRPPEMTTPGQGYTGGTIGGQVMSDYGKRQQQTAATLKASLAASAANQPQAQQAAPQWQTPQLTPRQATVPVPITPLAATPQFGATTQGAAAPIMPVPQANAPGAAPIFSLGAGQQNWMLPQAQPTAMQATPGMQPFGEPQRFQAGGPVKSNQPNTGFQIGTSDPGAQTGWYNPLYGGSALGAWALGMPLVVNPTPSGTPSAKSGVATVGGPTVYQMPAGMGTMDWNQVGQAAGLSQRDIDQFQAMGRTPADVAKQFNVQSPLSGPWTQVPGLFNKAPTPTVQTQAAPGWSAANPNMPLTAQTPANAAAMPQMPITPAANAAVPQQMALTTGAQPPAAPGAGQVSPMSSASNWTGAPYTGSVHNDPYMSHAVSGLLGLPTNPWHDVNPHTGAPYGGQAAAGAQTALATGPTIVPSGGPKKMQTGGPVPGQGDDDNVPALLTPGEYVLNKQQVKQLTQGRPVQLGQLPQAPQPQTTPTVGAGIRPGMTIQPGSPIGPNAAGGVAGVGATPMQAKMQANMAAHPGATTAMNVAGGIGDAINQAMQTWAGSIKPWETQASAIPNPDDFRRQQQVSLQEPRVT